MRVVWWWALFAGCSLEVASGTPFFWAVVAVWFGPLLACALLATRIESAGRQK